MVEKRQWRTISAAPRCLGVVNRGRGHRADERLRLGLLRGCVRALRIVDALADASAKRARRSQRADQALAITGINIKSIPSAGRLRWSSSSALAGGVAVFTALLAMATGFGKYSQATAAADAVIVMRAARMPSSIPGWIAGRPT